MIIFGTYFISQKRKQMIIDSLENASRYYGMHPLFQKAFEYIAATDLISIEDGKYEVAEGLKAIFSNAPGKTAEASLAKFECHNKNIDIQLCIKGNESIGWKPRQKCEKEKAPSDEQKDVTFYDETPDMFFGLTDCQFCILFPEDVHAPMIGEGLIKKLVIKVKI
jgi:YhcH/YjgK/YiaL family protein